MAEQGKDGQGMTREQALELESKAIEALLQLGVKFTVPLGITPQKPPKWLKWWNKHFPAHLKVWRDKRLPESWDVTVDDVPNADLQTLAKQYVRNFTVKPLYLGTIDYLRKLYLEIEYNEQTIQDEPIQESKRLFKYVPLMAEIAAVAVINDPKITTAGSKEVKELKQFFMEHLTVNRLQRLSDVISQMMNPAGFIYSIRSIREMGATRPKTPTKANLVE